MPVLGYWSIRGLAAGIRDLLNYVGEEFEDKLYDCGPAPDFDRSCWFGEKFTLGLDFPNLPYFLDGDIKITQSSAIMRYIGRKHNLCGTTDLERARVDMMCEQAMDFRNALIRLCYNPKGDTMLDGYLKNLPTNLDSFEKFLGDRPFFSADTPTFPDFHMYELLVQHRELFKGCLDDYPKLNAFIDRYEALPAIKNYRASERYRKLPINNKMAKFGASL